MKPHFGQSDAKMNELASGGELPLHPVVRPVKWHHLKCWPEYFAAMMRGDKLFDARIFDRDYQVCDYIVEEEWNPKTGTYTGRTLSFGVRYILDGGQFGVEIGHCILGLTQIPA